MRIRSTVLAAILSVFINVALAKNTVEFTAQSILINGEPKILRGGTLQWFRIPQEEWEDRLMKFKSMGYNMLDMYVAWRCHEPEQGKFDFTTYDIVKYLKLTQKYGLYVYFRPGPYITNEMDAGGLPYWVRTKASKQVYDPHEADGIMNLRTDDVDFLEAVQRYYFELNEVIRPFLFTNGGNIILYAIENELNWFVDSIDRDKLSDIDQTPERLEDFNPNHGAYMSALRDFATESGIDVPITQCPGDASLTATFDQPDIHPLPNIYFSLDTAEYSAVKIEKALREKERNGVYNKTPLGVTETGRDPWVLRRLIMAGSNLISQFNIFGYHQEGRMNGMGTNTDGYYGYSTNELMKQFITRMLNLKDVFNVGTGLLRFPFGLYPSTIDFNGAVTPSGELRRKFYQIRKTNMFIDSFEKMIAEVQSPHRIAWNRKQILWSNYTVEIKTRGVQPFGSKDPDANGAHVNYWLPLLNGSAAFLSLYNDRGWGNIELPPRTISAFGMEFPEFSKLVIPTEVPEVVTRGNLIERSYDMFIPIRIPLSEDILLRYSTSEVLTYTSIEKNHQVLIVYGKDGHPGELSLLVPSVKVKHLNHGVRLFTQSNNRIKTFVFEHDKNTQFVVLQNGNTKLTIVILDYDLAGRTHLMGDYILFGFDMVFKDRFGGLKLHQNSLESYFGCLSTRPMEFSNSAVLNEWYPATGYSYHSLVQRGNKGIQKSIALERTYIRDDTIEADPTTDTSSWKRLGPISKSVEEIGSSGGFMWYRSTVLLNETDVKGNLGLHVDSVSDFASLYVNGHYITTLFPIGTEINSTALDKYIKFNIPTHVWKVGENIITFRIEIWGCGSFMFPQGKIKRVNIGGKMITIPGLKISLPGFAYDTLKGIRGNGYVGTKKLVNWRARPGLGGEIQGYMKQWSMRGWKETEISSPWRLPVGKVTWLTAQIPTDKILEISKWDISYALELKGKNIKATVWMNGRLVGRWLSDDDWLQRGHWGRAVRDLWSPFTSVDRIILARELIKESGGKIVIVLEDVGDATRREHAFLEVMKVVPTTENQVLEKMNVGITYL